MTLSAILSLTTVLAQEATLSSTDWTTVIVAVVVASAGIIPSLITRRDRIKERKDEEAKHLREDAAGPLGDASALLNAAKPWVSQGKENAIPFDLTDEAARQREDANRARPLLRTLAGLWPEVAEDINTVEGYLGQLPNHLQFVGELSRVDADAFADDQSERNAWTLLERLEEDYWEARHALNRLYGRLPPWGVEDENQQP